MGSPVEIIIKKNEAGQGTKPMGEGASPSVGTEQGKTTIQQSAVNTALIGAGKQVMLNGLRQYGNITGDYMMMESFDNTLSIGADLLMIAKGGVIGALAVGTKYAINISNSFIQQELAYKNIDLISKRAGDIANKGSR